jgi:hypothetical protein
MWAFLLHIVQVTLFRARKEMDGMWRLVEVLRTIDNIGQTLEYGLRG